MFSQSELLVEKDINGIMYENPGGARPHLPFSADYKAAVLTTRPCAG